MALLKVLTVPDPRLRQKAKPVERVDDNIRALMDDMLETMNAEDGCGLAATQVGVLLRVLVVDVSYKFPEIGPLKIANPEIIWQSETLSTYEEGCLSVPEQFAPVSRPESITLRYLDENNNTHEETISGFLATALQHEIDHLEGKVFIDYLPPIKREMFIRKAKRAAKNTP